MGNKKQSQKRPIGQEDFSRYKAVFENMEESYVELDLAGNVIFFNDSLCKALGYSAEELMGMNYKQYVSPENSERVYGFFHELYRTGTPGKLMDYQVITKDGSGRVFEASATLIRDPSGKPIKFRSLGRDITDRKHAEEDYREARKNIALFLRILKMATSNSILRET